MADASAAATSYVATTIAPTKPAPLPDDVQERRHHAPHGTGFVNPWPSWRNMSLWTIFRGFMLPSLTGQLPAPDTTPPTVPVRTPHFLPTRDTRTLRATWLGHAAYYVEFPSGLRVLFDPVFSERCSPFSFLGPKRYTPVPCPVQSLPFIDAVVISHNHYDHLDHPTILEIARCHPHAHFFVPLGNRQWFARSNIPPQQVTELDWWDEQVLQLRPAPLVTDSKAEDGHTTPPAIVGTFGALPCQHTSARGITDRAKTLWASWSVESGGATVFFGGDTGYRAVPQLPADEDDWGPGHDYPHCPAFAQIGQLRGPFDLGLIPIGAYNPRWVMSPMHANPFDSVKIFQDTQCKRAMGIHWGTWVLTNEAVLEPPKLLKEALRRNNLPEEGLFDVCDIGESREF